MLSIYSRYRIALINISKDIIFFAFIKEKEKISDRNYYTCIFVDFHAFFASVPKYLESPLQSSLKTSLVFLSKPGKNTL